MTDYGWPPRMITRVASAYTGRSRWALARAVREGALTPAGKNGRSLVFERGELDRWMVGTTPAPAPSAPERLPRPLLRSSASSDALTRLRELAAGGR